MNTKSKDGKKRIAHVGSSSSNTVEYTEKHQDDYLASILERMESNDKQIVSYEQLNDYRKSKFKPVLPDIEINQPVESSGSFKLKKKPGPLMAKCQRNLKYLKHNRRIPKPRAHVGSLAKETQSVNLSTELKKNIDARIKPKKVQKNSSELPSSKTSMSLPLHTKTKKHVPSVVNKPNEEWNGKILKSQICTEAKKRKISEQSDTESRSKNGTETRMGKISKQSESVSRFSVETNSSDGVKHDSSEESDNFESFIRQQVVSHSKQTSKHNSVKKRKKVQKRKVLKRITNRNASESDSDDSALKESLETNKLKKSMDLEDVNYNSDNGSRDNSLQFDFDNACDDSSDNCEANETLCKTPQVDNVLSFSPNLLNENSKTVEQSVDILSNYDLSGSCLSSSITADCSPQISMSNKESNQSENYLPIDQVSSSMQELSESKNASEKDQAGGYESDDCVILENSPPAFNIKISAVKSVAMLPTTDEDENTEAVLVSTSPQKKGIDKTSKNESNKLDRDIQTGTLNQQAIISFGNESNASVLNVTDSNKQTHYESDDCLILDDESLSDTTLKLNSRDSLKNRVSSDTKQSVIPPLKVCHGNVPLDSIKDAQTVEDSNQKGSSLSSSRYKPDALSHKNVWDVLKAIDFEKLKSVPELSATQSSSIPSDSVPNSLSKVKIKSEELSNVFIADEIQSSSSLPQEKPCLAFPNKNSTSSKNYRDVELIDLSDNEDASQNDVSSSGVLDENDLNFHKSLMSNDFSHNKFPLKQEVMSTDVKVKKEAPSTSDELDISSASSLRSLYSSCESDVRQLLGLYHKEYQQYKEIEKTGINLSDGLRLLLKGQVKKLSHIKSAIKNIIKHDPCFLKASKNVKPDVKPINCDVVVKKEQDWEKKTKPSSQLSENPQLSDSEHPELSIYTESVLLGIQKVVGNTLPPESSLRAEKVKEQLRDAKCAQCGRTASAACQGCFKVFYCSTECGMSDWEKGHSFSCGT